MLWIMAERRWPCGPGARLATARSSDPTSPTSWGGVCVQEETRKDRNAKFYSTQVFVGNGPSRDFAGLRGFGASRDFAGLRGASRDFAGLRGTSRDFAGRRGTSRDFAGLRGTSRDFAGLRGTSRDFAGLRGTSRDFAGLRGTSRDFAGLRGTSRDFAGLRGTSRLHTSSLQRFMYFRALKFIKTPSEVHGTERNQGVSFRKSSKKRARVKIWGGFSIYYKPTFCLLNE